MYRGTTPTIVFTINSDLDLNTIKEVWITFDVTPLLTFTKKDVEINDETKTITLNLTQEETLKFTKHEMQVQLRFLLEDGNAYASPIKNITVDKILKSGVIAADEQSDGD